MNVFSSPVPTDSLVTPSKNHGSQRDSDAHQVSPCTNRKPRAVSNWLYWRKKDIWLAGWFRMWQTDVRSVIFQDFFWKGLFFPTLLYGVFPRWNRWNKFTREASHRGCEVTQLSSLVMSSLLLLRTDFVVEFTLSAPLLMSSPPDLLRCQSSPCWIWVSLYFWPTLSGLEKKKNNRRLSVDVHTSDCAENCVDVNQKPIYNQ